MRAKFTPGSLEWSFLEVEEGEWNRLTDVLDAAAAANGFAEYAGLQQAGPGRLAAAPATDKPKGRTRQLLVNLAGVLLLLAAVSYRVWLAAQQGVDRMQQDIANVVKLETLKVKVEQPQLRQQVAIQAVEFLDDKAMAQALITRTLPSGGVIVQQKALFYTQTSGGWRRTAPLAAFWGEPQTLDTPNLHFVFRSRDRAAVEQLAPGAEALYVSLRRATGQTLAATHDRLTVEIAPEQISPHEEFVHGRVRLASPLLFDLAFGYTAEGLLAHLARRSLATQMLGAALRQTTVKPQWQRMVQGLHSWLLYSDVLPLAPAAEQAGYQPQGRAYHSWRLSDLLGCHPCTNLNFDGAHTAGLPSSTNNQQQAPAAAASLINSIVASHGLDVMPALLQGFGQHEEWETLAPAVLGVSAADLEVAWQGAVTVDP